MRKWKQRLVMLLCLAMLVPMFTVTMPQEADAATIYSVFWHYSIAKYDKSVAYPSNAARVVVEQGQSFVLADYITIYVTDTKNYKVASKSAVKEKKFKYKSDDSQIVNINQKSVISAKKEGTTKVTVKPPYKGCDPLICTIQVVKKGSLTKKVKNASKVNALLAKMEKYSTKKINLKSATELLPVEAALDKYLISENSSASDPYIIKSATKADKGKLKHRHACIYNTSTYSNNKPNMLVLPKFMTYVRVREALDDFICSNEATFNGSASISETDTTGTIVLDQNIKTPDLLAIARFFGDTTKYNAKKPYTLVTRFDCEEYSEGVDVELTFKPNSKNVSFKLKSGKFLEGSYIPFDDALGMLGNISIDVESTDDEDDDMDDDYDDYDDEDEVW